MKKFTNFLSVLFLVISASAFSQGITENTWQNGDIIFIKNNQMPNTASAGDKKQFNCMGLILHEKDGHAYVYYVGDQLKKVRIDEFIQLAEDKKYSVKWLMENELVTEDVINTMRTFVTAKLGTPNDTNENLNSEELYNAEFIWKIYLSTLGVKLCEPKELTASGDPKKDVSSQGFANKSVSVRDIYKSEILE